MTLKNRKITNAIFIKLKNTLSSPAIKITLFIAFLASTLISFSPYITDKIFNDHIVVNSNIDLKVENNDFEIINDNSKNIDIKVDKSKENYNIHVLTKKGYDNVSKIVDRLNEINLTQYIKNNNLTQQDLKVLTNGNLNISISKEITQINEELSSFLMMLVMVFFLVMNLLVARIGVQVAFEKGNKITETILTSISRKEMFLSQVVSSIIVTIFSFILISIPMIIAYIVDDIKIASDFTFFTPKNIVLFLFHLITVSSSLILFSIAICSCVKQAEDANTMSILVLAPILISYIYYIFNFDLYKGGWCFLNYIPMFSAYPVFGGILSGTLSDKSILIFCFIDVIFFAVSYLVSRYIYCKNI